MMGRTVCLIQGCERTTARFASAHWICPEHWRAFVPPGSKERRVYLRFHRLGRKFGWPKDLRIRFWRFWNALERRVQRRAGGDIDKAEIDRLFGWKEA